jgi:hypothetical protein
MYSGVVSKQIVTKNQAPSWKKKQIRSGQCTRHRTLTQNTGLGQFGKFKKYQQQLVGNNKSFPIVLLAKVPLL